MNVYEKGKILSADQFQRCQNTISSYAFYYMVCHHVLSKTPMSVVRMGDGERIILEASRLKDQGHIPIATRFDDAWAVRMGWVGADMNLAASFIDEAARDCTYFAPNIVGVTWDSFDLYKYYPERNVFVDNFFVNQWRPDQIQALFEQAQDIVVLHRDPEIGAAFELKSNDMYKFIYVPLYNWDEVDNVVEQVGRLDAQLVLISGNKTIGPRLTNKYGKICLDVGNAIGNWIC